MTALTVLPCSPFLALPGLGAGVPLTVASNSQARANAALCRFLIEAGAVLGKGCLVTAGSRVRGTFGDFAVLSGNPAQVVGDTRTQDARWLAVHPDYLPAYERWAGKLPQA